MTVISVNDVSLSFGARELFKNISFSLETNDRLGIVGPNGCGKSTLLSLLLRENKPDEGSVFIAADTSVGILTQDSTYEISAETGATALEQMYAAFPEHLRAERRIAELEEWLAANPELSMVPKYASITKEFTDLHDRYARDGGLTFRSRCHSILEGMGFTEEQMSLPIEALSGGQRTRLALSRRLCREPDLLLLDEPTNHLDADTLAWLESFLSSYSGCLITVSHDRRFLDKVTNKTLLFERGRAKLYKGSYTACAEQRRRDREILEKQYKDQQKEIARQEAYIEQQRRWNRERNIIAAESRLKMLAKIDRIAAPEKDEKTVKMQFSRGLQSGNDILDVRKLSFRYPSASFDLLRELNFQVKRGERVFIVGPNGCGKSTLIKLLLGDLDATGGIIDYGHNLQIGYYDQENQGLDERNTVLEELWSLYPDMKEKDARGALGSFLFRGDDVFKPVSVLSGGERARLTLVKLMLSKMNVLILDEPTNHLDIGSREALEDALAGFDGTLICVSHDRAFIDRLATRLLCFDDAGKLVSLPIGQTRGAWDEWQAYRENGRVVPVTVTVQKPVETVSDNKADYLRRKSEAAEARKQASRLARLKKEQEELEAELDTLSAELYGDAASDYVRAAEIQTRIDEIEERLMEIYEETEV